MNLVAGKGIPKNQIPILGRRDEEVGDSGTPVHGVDFTKVTAEEAVLGNTEGLLLVTLFLGSVLEGG